MLIMFCIDLNSIRSSSTLPAPQPSSQPPTPTRIAGAANSFQFDDRGEDRGDLIKFYNMVRNVKITELLYCCFYYLDYFRCFPLYEECDLTQRNFLMYYVFCIQIYVGRIKNYALKFSSQNLKDGVSCCRCYLYN